MPSEREEFTAACRIPDLHGLVPASGHDALAIAAKRDRPHRLAVPCQRQDLKVTEALHAPPLPRPQLLRASVQEPLGIANLRITDLLVC